MTILTDSIKSHLQMATMAMAAHDLLKPAPETRAFFKAKGTFTNAPSSGPLPETIAFLKAAAEELGVALIVMDPQPTSMRSGEIHVLRGSYLVAHYSVDSDGKLTDYLQGIGEQAA